MWQESLAWTLQLSERLHQIAESPEIKRSKMGESGVIL